MIIGDYTCKGYCSDPSLLSLLYYPVAKKRDEVMYNPPQIGTNMGVHESNPGQGPMYAPQLPFMRGVTQS